MRKVAGYALFSPQGPQDATNDRYRKVRSLIDVWQQSKGEVQQRDDAMELVLRDGRVAEFERVSAASLRGELSEITITEPTDSGLFQTHVVVAKLEERIVVYVELRAAGGPYQVGPMYVDVRCPNLIHQIVESGDDWFVGESLLSAKPFDFTGSDGGEEFVKVAWHPNRNLPIVAVSPFDSHMLTETFVSDLARDLCGIALVVRLDEQASWRLTNTKGKEWSCYSGAVRIYWPRIQVTDNPLAHPLWTRFSLLRQVATPQDAANRFRRQIRRRIMGLSAFSVREPREFSAIRSDSERTETEKLREVLREASNWEALANDYSQENDRLRSSIDKKTVEISELREQVANLQLALRWQPADADDVKPQDEPPPTTVLEAIQQAQDKHAGTLVFGDDVLIGVDGLSRDAGPPEKVAQYLSVLAEMGTARRVGSLGKSAIIWLRDRGVSASAESDAVKNSSSEMAKRTWRDGAGRRAFDFHLKPNEAVAPDRCVRIYFDYDEELGKVIVGWIGRHP